MLFGLHDRESNIFSGMSYFSHPFLVRREEGGGKLEREREGGDEGFGCWNSFFAMYC